MSEHLKKALLAAEGIQGISLSELEEQISILLPQIAPQQSRYKVVDIPDSRTIRYYISQGLVPKPLNYQGGRANYGGEHILSLLFIKKMQAEHYSLRQIKQALLAMQKTSRKNTQAFLQQLVIALVDQVESDAVVLPVKPLKKALPSRLSVGVDAIQEPTAPYQVEISGNPMERFFLHNDCTVFVSTNTLQDEQLRYQLANQLEEFAEQLRNSGSKK